MNTLVTFSAITEHSDNLAVMRRLLTYPLIGWTSQYFSRVRDPEAELLFVKVCRGIMAFHSNEITEKEYWEYDRVLLGYELSAYDHLNMWADYILLYEQAVNDGRYQSQSWDRYPIICRKQKRLEAGKGVEHLKRHQQSQLTDEELADRYAEMLRLFLFIKDKTESRAKP
jgi:hypothetical protein